MKAEGGLSEEAYRRLYLTGAVSPKFCGLPKVHKPGIPLRPIVSSTGTVTYSTAKELAKILKPLVGMSSHHVHNTRHFVEHLKDVRLKQGECIISYDVTAFCTSVPIQPVVNIIQQRLANDKDLQQRTTMSIKHIISLLNFLPKEYRLCVPGAALSTNGRGSNGKSTQPYSGQHLCGEF